MATLELDGASLTLEQFARVASGDGVCRLAESARARIAAGRQALLDLPPGRAVYGVNTGFGDLASVRIEPDRLRALQRRLLHSHAAGMGEPLGDRVVRGMLLLRANTLARGRSGVRVELVERLLELLARDMLPRVPSRGSVGASGDLAPLAHVAMALMGEGEVLTDDGDPRPAAEALEEHGIAPLELRAKDGLALINGTDGILGMLVLACRDFRNLLTTSEIAAAMSVEGLLATNRPFAEDLVGLRPHPGQAVSAAVMRAMLDGSRIVASHRYDDPRVQDAYSLRCAPQVLGAARDAVAYAEAVAARELRSAIDNPMVMSDGRIESGGNFHGAPLAHTADFLAIAAADVGALAERRTDRMLDPARSEGLPAFLTPDPGVNSGLMIAHYTMAAMVAANRQLATPASTDSLPTSAGQEDHVSMGWGAARKLRVMLDNLARIVAVELVAAARALDFRSPLEPARGTAAVRNLLREHVPTAEGDHFVATGLAAAERLVRDGAVVEAAESAAGRLHGT